MDKMIPFTAPFPKRLLLFICITAICMIAGSVVMTVVLAGGQTVRALRLATVAQDVILFMAPPVVCALLITRLPASLLCLDRLPTMRSLLLAIAAMIVAIPWVNALVEWNESLSLPAALAPVEEWMRHSEESAAAAVNTLMGGTTAGSLVMSVLIVGLLAGLSEELFFRAGLQRLLSTRPMNVHLAVWTTAFIFSAIHLQFFGFFPRLLLGAFFGYLLAYSGSLWLPVICHVTNNSIVAVTTWQHARGVEAARVLNELGTSAGTQSALLVSVSLAATALILYALLRKQSPAPRPGTL